MADETPVYHITSTVGKGFAVVKTTEPMWGVVGFATAEDAQIWAGKLVVELTIAHEQLAASSAKHRKDTIAKLMQFPMDPEKKSN